ncbi:MAG: dockerin type I repeat-containing protein, partial [Ruminococcus sp.]|nr:dockerin type I repeat-containing protein [Ruminococcus sp.]
ELSRTAKTLAKKAHTISYVAQVDATATKDGMKAHYECSVCNKLFSDKDGKNEVTVASLIIPATGVSKGILGDANGDGEVEIDDTTFIQRILLDLIVPDDGMILRGNVDGSDEGLDIIDATFIQRHLLGVPVPYSIGEEIK